MVLRRDQIKEETPVFFKISETFNYKAVNTTEIILTKLNVKRKHTIFFNNKTGIINIILTKTVK